MSYYPPYRSSSNKVKVELDLSNYATEVTGIDNKIKKTRVIF